MTRQEATNRPGDRAAAQPVSVTPPRSPRRAGWRIWPLVACGLLVTPIVAAAKTGPTDAKAPAPTATVAGTTPSATEMLGSGLTAGVPVAVPALGSPDSGALPAPPDVEEMQGGGSPPTETVEFYAYDAIGSVRVVFDLAGAVVGQATYSPFGQEIAGTTGMPSRRFTGQERDHEAQLDYFNARSFQARTGRFGAPDPVWGGSADPQRWNRYAYGLNNPLSFVDPAGLQASQCSADFCVTVVCGSDCQSTREGGSDTLGHGGGGWYWWGLGTGGSGGSPGGSRGGLGASGGGSGAGGGGGQGPAAPVPPGPQPPACPGGPDCPSSTVPPGKTTKTEEAETSLLDVCLMNTGNAAAGFGDTLTSGFGLAGLFGLPSGTEYVRQALGWDDVVQRDTGAYIGGTWGGEAWGLLAGGTGALRKAGYEMLFAHYRRAGGVGVTLKREGKRVFGLDWHKFTLNGQKVNRPHYHCGPTRSQIDKHRPWQ